MQKSICEIADSFSFSYAIMHKIINFPSGQQTRTVPSHETIRAFLQHSNSFTDFRRIPVHPAEFWSRCDDQGCAVLHRYNREPGY